MKVIAVIPVRLDSRRLPGKALRELAGKPLVQWVYERVRAARRPDRVLVATDSAEVEAACRRFSAEVFLSRSEHACGTDRVAEAVAVLGAGVIVNVQGDLPMLDPDLIDSLIDLFEDPEVEMASASAPIQCTEDLLNPNIVKVVCDRNCNALYFSRAPIPWYRDHPPRGDAPLPSGFRPFRHIGIYAYSGDCLAALAASPPDPLEKIESLEQLRALRQGRKIRILEWDYRGIDVDTPEDLDKLRKILKESPAGDFRTYQPRPKFTP